MNETDKHKIYRLAKNSRCPDCGCTVHGVCRLHKTVSETFKDVVRAKHGREIKFCRCQLK